MKRRLFYFLLAVGLTLCARAWGGRCLAQSPPAAPPNQEAKQENKAAPKVNSEILKKLAGRYELEAGLIPVSTLDVTLEGGEL